MRGAEKSAVACPGCLRFSCNDFQKLDLPFSFLVKFFIGNFLESFFNPSPANLYLRSSQSELLSESKIPSTAPAILPPIFGKIIPFSGTGSISIGCQPERAHEAFTAQVRILLVGLIVQI